MQKICSRCGKQLSSNERSLDMIQCTHCYETWIQDVFLPLQAHVRDLITRLRESDLALGR